MPIRIPDSLPATEILTSENIFVMTEQRAESQDIRPLNICVLNLMPTKIPNRDAAPQAHRQHAAPGGCDIPASRFPHPRTRRGSIS